MFGIGLLTWLVMTAISLYVLYWVIRLAVRHALSDEAGRWAAPPAADRTGEDEH